MRIAVNARFLLPNKLEGIGRFTHEICRRMVEQHPEHEFIFFFDRPYDEQFIYGKNVTPVVLFPPARHPFLYMCWFEWSVARAIKRYQADVFVSTDGYAVLHTDVPTLLVIHDIAWYHIPNAMSTLGLWYHHFFVKRFAHKAAKVLGVSQFTKHDLIRTFHLPENKVDVVYNAPSEDFKPLNAHQIQAVRTEWTDGKPYFLYVGAMHPRKNIANLLKAYDTYSETYAVDMPLVIVGRKAWATREIEETFERMTYKHRVLFTGRVSETVLHQLVASAYCMVYIPFFEGFGLPIVESMACGVPVITSDCTSMPEVGGDAACYCNPHDVSSIVQAMHSLVSEVVPYDELKQRSLARADSFQWNQSATAFWNHIMHISRS